MPRIEVTNNSTCWWGCEERGMFIYADRRTAGSDTMEISVEFPKKCESGSSTRPNYITLGFYPKGTISYY